MEEPTPPLPSLLNPGPIDDSLLYEQNTHVSNAAWNDKEVVFQTRNTNSCPRNLDERVQRCLVVAGFYGLYHLGHFPVDRGQISSLIERWRPETHTFHMPMGECTITLQDIEILGGVRVDGNPVVGNFGGVQSWSNVVRDMLGVEPDSEAFKGNTQLRLRWIKDYVLRRDLEHGASPERVAQYTRGCILLLLGGQFLSDKSGDSVKVAFVHFLANLEECGEYSWGSAILANLYFEMCGVATKGNTDIGGALIFLQLWAWHRLTIWTPLSRTTLPAPPGHLDGFPTLPYGSRLSRARARDYNPTVVHHNHIFPRDQLDMLMDEQVTFMLQFCSLEYNTH